MKNYSKLVAFGLTATMAMSMLAGCGNNAQPAEDSSVINEEDSSSAAVSSTTSSAASSAASSTTSQTTASLDFEDSTKAAEANDVTNYDSTNWTDESNEVYKNTLGAFEEEYAKAENASSISERYAFMAIAEAKMLENAVMLPLTSQGGSYTISKVVPKSGATVLYGTDSDRFYQNLVVDKFISPADRDEIKAKWNEITEDESKTGTFREWVIKYLKDKGYKLQDKFNYVYADDPVTWDTLGTNRNPDNIVLINTWDSLYQYDCENKPQPALAESYEVSDDGLTYTFHLRKGVKWVDSQGREVADLTADDFVAGMQHLLDAKAGLEYLVGNDGADILNADKYVSGDVTDFAEVGVKAVDDTTLQYTLEKPCSFFMTMLSYSVFAPMSRSYYTSQGGKFGAEFSADAADYKYGKDKDHIAYCGPYLITNATEKNTIVFKANDSYYNKDAITLKTVTWMYDDNTDATRLYNLAKDGTTDAAPLTTSSVEAAKKDGIFDKYAYVSDTDATSYMGFLNLNRKAFANFNDSTKAVSSKTVGEANRTHVAMQNLNFRRAICNSVDRASYNAQRRGEDCKLNNLRNSYVPGNFVTLEEDINVDINGTSKEFKAGTNFGEIVQEQLNADGWNIKVWDAENAVSDGFDGWYNPDLAKEEINAAAKELADQGLTIDKDHPIQIDIPTYTGSEVFGNMGNVIKQSIEASTDGLVKVNIVECVDQDSWTYAGFYPEYGYQTNADMTDVSGWGPDYGDPQTYLGTLLSNYSGAMTKNIGMY